MGEVSMSDMDMSAHEMNMSPTCNFACLFFFFFFWICLDKVGIGWDTVGKKIKDFGPLASPSP